MQKRVTQIILQPHLRLITLTLAALMQQHLEDEVRKNPKDLTDGVTVRVGIEIWDSCSDFSDTIYMQKAAAHKVPGHSILCCAVWRGGTSRFNAVGEFFLSLS